MKLFKLFTLVLILTSLFVSCKKDKKSKEITVEYPVLFADKFVGETHGVDSLIERVSFEFPTSLDGELAKNNSSKSKITSAKLVFLKLQILDIHYNDSLKYSNFKDLSELYFDIYSTGVGQELIGEKQIPDIRTRAIDLNIQDNELKKYLVQDKFGMVVKYKKRRGMLHDMPFVISGKFVIKAETF